MSDIPQKDTLPTLRVLVRYGSGALDRDGEISDPGGWGWVTFVGTAGAVIGSDGTLHVHHPKAEPLPEGYWSKVEQP